MIRKTSDVHIYPNSNGFLPNVQPPRFPQVQLVMVFGYRVGIVALEGRVFKLVTCTRHAWTNDAGEQVKLAKAGRITFSHPNGVPLDISVKRTGVCCKRVVATTLEELWYSDACGTVSVPAKFTYDCASVPSWLWNLIDPIELAYESAFHDAGYRSQLLTKEYVDFQFYYLMKARGKSWYVRWAAYYAVRLFGKKAWNQNARRKTRDKK